MFIVIRFVLLFVLPTKKKKKWTLAPVVTDPSCRRRGRERERRGETRETTTTQECATISSKLLTTNLFLFFFKFCCCYFFCSHLQYDMSSRFFFFLFFIGYQNLEWGSWRRTVDWNQDWLVCWERERESERTGASRNKTRSEINQTGTHCCELGCLNVTLLIPVPKVQEKWKKKKKHRDYFAYILYSVLMLVHCY